MEDQAEPIMRLETSSSLNFKGMDAKFMPKVYRL